MPAKTVRKPKVTIPMVEQMQIVYISHTASTAKAAEAIVDFLVRLGLRWDEMVCSSIPPVAPPEENAQEWLDEKKETTGLVLAVASEDSKTSADFKCEIQHFQVETKPIVSFFVPGYDFRDDPIGLGRYLGIKLDGDKNRLHYALAELAALVGKALDKEINPVELLWAIERFIEDIEKLKMPA
ncbi:MAG: hypothetical protein LBN05_04325 [Oscillospiraceae bacterium]|jgi:hypothetical protein|nr:hypothetical protein [Oscillospiraceae bacterium]